MGHDYPVAIRQEITGSNHFAGVAPPAGPTFANSVYTFAAATSGGLFAPADAAW